MTEITIRPLTPDDRDAWQVLWEGYNTFYERTVPDAVTQTTWERFFDGEEPVHARVAERAGRLVGLVHFLYHRNTAMLGDVCYLQDLFTAEDARGLGVGRRLIEVVYAEAERAGAPRVYWLTHETNTRAMHLYEQVATRTGFIQYRKDLGG